MGRLVVPRSILVLERFRRAQSLAACTISTPVAPQGLHRTLPAKHLFFCEVLSHTSSHQSECRNAMPPGGLERPHRTEG